MAFRIRASKFRHVYGEAHRKERCYENVRITRNAHDGNFCAVNPKYLAVVTESSGGGSFVVLPLSRVGRVDINSPKVCGHAGGVLDIKWNPFKDDIIASGSDDCTVKVWHIPDGGLRGNLTEWQVDLHGHGRRVLYLEWHPTTENIIVTAGADHKCIVWNVEQAEPVNVISCHNDLIQSLSWSRDGNQFCATCKDKSLKVIDPRAGKCVGEAGKFFSGFRPSKALYLGDSGKIFCTGFENRGERECAIWDVRKMSERLASKYLDSSFGILMPYYDYDTQCVFLAGKGDGNISYYEIVNESPHIHYLNNYGSSTPQRGFGVMPKRGCDPSKCEIMRFYKLHAARNYVEPISMIVPRKNNLFHDDLFPPTASAIPSLSADEWISGQNRDPILISMKDKEVVNDPKITPCKAVQHQDGALNQAPTITTYKAVSKQRTSSTSDNEAITMSSKRQDPKKIPASLRNIKQLSTSEDIVTLSAKKEEAPVTNTEPEEKTEAVTTETERAFVNSKIAAFERSSSTGNETGVISPNRKRSERKSWGASQGNPPDVIQNGIKTMAEKQSGNKNNSSLNEAAQFFEHKEIEIIEISSNEKVENKDNSHNDNQVNNSSSTDTKTSSGKLSLGKLNNNLDQSDGHLRKAYFRQAEEIKALKGQISLKDKRIRQLEDEVSLLRKVGETSVGESDC